jgi:phasin
MNQAIDFEIPASVREIASKSVEQARDAYNRFVDATRQAQDIASRSAEVFTTGAREINERALQYAEANVQASFEAANRLVKAKDIKEALDIQSQFARKQFETYTQQAQELSRIVAVTAQKAQPAAS